MKTRFTNWQERDGRFLGHLNDDPGRWTRVEGPGDPKDHPRMGCWRLEGAA